MDFLTMMLALQAVVLISLAVSPILILSFLLLPLAVPMPSHLKNERVGDRNIGVFWLATGLMMMILKSSVRNLAHVPAYPYMKRMTRLLPALKGVNFQMFEPHTPFIRYFYLFCVNSFLNRCK